MSRRYSSDTVVTELKDVDVIESDGVNDRQSESKSFAEDASLSVINTKVTGQESMEIFSRYTLSIHRIVKC